MALKEGIYEIRYVPEHIKPPFVGGLYATADEINAPVRAEGMNAEAVIGTQNVRIIFSKLCLKGQLTVNFDRSGTSPQ